MDLKEFLDQNRARLVVIFEPLETGEHQYRRHVFKDVPVFLNHPWITIYDEAENTVQMFRDDMVQQVMLTKKSTAKWLHLAMVATEDIVKTLEQTERAQQGEEVSVR